MDTTKANGIILMDTTSTDRQLIMLVTGLDENAMNNLLLDLGMDYIRIQCQGHATDYQDVRDMAFYWAWWVKQWQIREELFLAYHQLREMAACARIMDKPVRTDAKMLAAYTYMHREAMQTDHLSTGYMHIMTPLVKKARKEKVL